MLLAAGQPVVLQGGERMPIKYGITAMDLFGLLDLDLAGLSLNQVQAGFDTHGFALIHQPDHFSIADSLVGYREDPATATGGSLELLTAHEGAHLLVSGFVHPPTESRAWEALRLAGETDVLTVKGLEGELICRSVGPASQPVSAMARPNGRSCIPGITAAMTPTLSGPTTRTEGQAPRSPVESRPSGDALR